ncbi:MAG: hypothetical protein KDD45_02835, partial [Bdellovibrionales bacterium]|nr:hypothetical protein [Bdellovibrionales bacterium]
PQSTGEAVKSAQNTTQNPTEKIIRTFLSNLDPEQYVGYYPLESQQKIRYIDTWMCEGPTNGKPYCPNPRLKPDAPTQEPLNGT